MSGLGADERAFQDFTLNHNITYLPWLVPETNETFESYAKRMAGKITAPMPVLIGLSFGGMMAVEIAKHIQTDKVILISSAKTKNEIPFYYRLAGNLSIDKLLPAKILKRRGAIKNWLLGLKTSKEKKHFNMMLKESNDLFFKWSIRCIITWQNEKVPENLYHIHGNADKTLPLKFIKANRIVKGGGHSMILNKADEISKIVEEILSPALPLRH